MPKFNLYDQKIDFAAIKETCREKGTHTHYAKDEPFVHQGYVGKYLGVVESGYFKYVTLTSSGDEAVVGFASKARSSPTITIRLTASPLKSL